MKLFAAENALLRCKKQKQSKNLAFYSVGIAEILLMSTSEMVGKTIRELDFRARYGVNVLGVRRHSDYLLRNIGDIRLHASTSSSCKALGKPFLVFRAKAIPGWCLANPSKPPAA